MRSVVWSEKALVDFINKISDIAKESPENATLIADHVEQAVVELRDVPTGRFGLVRGAHKIQVPQTSFVIAFQVDADGNLAVVRIIKAAQGWLK
jgi:plasmid stabilization system protein ParE